MVIKSKIKSSLSVLSRLTLLSFGIVALTFLPVQAQQSAPQLSSDGLTALEENTIRVVLATEPNEEETKEILPGTSGYHQPKISNAKLVSWGVETSLRAYFFETEQEAEAFPKAIATFKLATRFKLVVSATEIAMYDADNKKIIMPPNHAEQLEIDSGKVVLLAGTRKQQARVEKLMRALDAD